MGRKKIYKSGNSKKWLVYILALRDGSYYTGITNDLHTRLKKHKTGKGSKYVASRLPLKVVYVCYEENRSDATKREIKMKKMSKKEKETLVKGNWAKVDDKVNLYCEVCSTVTSIPRKDIQKWPKFKMNCIICNNIITYEEKNEQ